MPDGNRHRPTVAEGQHWRDQHGEALVHGVVQVERIAFAVMRRTREAAGHHKRRPFLLSVPTLLDRASGWRLVPTPSKEESSC